MYVSAAELVGFARLTSQRSRDQTVGIARQPSERNKKETEREEIPREYSWCGSNVLLTSVRHAPVLFRRWTRATDPMATECIAFAALCVPIRDYLDSVQPNLLNFRSQQDCGVLNFLLLFVLFSEVRALQLSELSWIGYLCKAECGKMVGFL